MQNLLRPVAWFEVDLNHEFYQRRAPVECIIDGLMRDVLLELETNGKYVLDYSDIEYRRTCAVMEAFLKPDVVGFLKKVTENNDRWKLLIWGTVSQKLVELKIQAIDSVSEMEKAIRAFQETHLTNAGNTELTRLRPVFVTKGPVWGLQGDKIQIAETVLLYDNQSGYSRYPRPDTSVAPNTATFEHVVKASSEEELKVIERRIDALA